MKASRYLTLGLLACASCANCPCAPGLFPCQVDEDCAGDEICKDGECQSPPPPSCLVDDDCAADRRCVNLVCEVGERPPPDAGPPDAGLQCAFGETVCMDQRVLRTCEFGLLATVDCARNGLVCREGRCQPAPCVPDGGATRCVDLATEQDCTPAGPGTMRDCPPHQACWRGRCAWASGEPCTEDVACAGGTCLCKPGECVGALAAGYCTQQPCNVEGGSGCPETDVCMGLASAGGGRQNACGQRAGDACPADSNGMPVGYAGPYRRVLPVPDPTNPERYTFGAAVCFDARPGAVGATCAGPTECMGGASVGFQGQCATFGGVVTGGYCTHACDATHPCPPEAACAHFPSDPAGAGTCLMRCGQQRPGLATCDRAGVACRTAVAGGFAILDGRDDPLGYCASR